MGETRVKTLGRQQNDGKGGSIQKKTHYRAEN